MTTTQANLGAIFSIPNPILNQTVLDAIVAPYAGTVSAFLTVRRCTIQPDSSHGLTEYIYEWCKTEADFNTVWNLAFGRIVEAGVEAGVERESTTAILANMALQIGVANGLPGSWRAGFDTPTLLHCGPVVLRAVAVETSVFNQSIRASFVDHDGATSVFQLDANRRLIEGAPSLMVAHNPPPWRVPLYSMGNFSDLEGQSQIFRDVEPVPCLSAEMLDAVSEGVRKVAAYSESYLTWIRRVVRGILLTRQVDGTRLVSGSGQNAPGIIHSACPLAPMETAEILVHEAAHQYFYLLERVGPLDTGQDARRYWSPPIRQYRPISRVLMAYHALVNVRHLYAQVLAQPLSETDLTYVAKYREGLERDIEILKDGIRSSSALSEVAWGLYNGLSEG